jgi:hypothetical protein
VRVAVSDLSSTILAEGAIELDFDHEATEGLDAAAEPAWRSNAALQLP